MRRINRLVAALSAQFSDLVDQIENHEAVAASTLKRFRVEIQEAKVQVKLLEKDLEQAQNSREQANQMADLWKKRAKRFGNDQKEKALECVQRHQNAHKEVEYWSDKAAAITGEIQNLKRELVNIETQYDDMKLELQKYVARDRTARLKNITRPLGHQDDQLHDVFRRWDKKLIHQEADAEITTQNVDEFAFELQAEEEAENLEKSLDEILSGKE